MMDLTALLDGWALALTHAPATVTGQRANDAEIAITTAVSRQAFGATHNRHTATALIPLLDAAQARDPQALNGRQVHLLFAIAGADLVEPDQLAAFLAAYVDPGVEIWYQPISVTNLRRALDAVLGPYEPAKRARLLTSLAEHTTVELLRWAPDDTWFSPAVGAKHVDNPKAALRRLIAVRPGLAPEAQRELLRDADELLCCALATNPGLVPELQARLATNSWIVRFTLAQNPGLTPELQTLLAADEEPRVRAALGENPNLRPELQARYIDDGPSSYLVESPNLTPELQHRLAHGPYPWMRSPLGRNPRLVPELQLLLARDDDPWVRKDLASNPNLTADAQALLAGDDDLEVRQELAANPRLTPAVQVLLARDADTSVRQRLTRHFDLVPEARATLELRPDDLAPVAKRRIDRSASAITDPHTRYRVALATGPVPERMIVAPGLERLAMAQAALAHRAHPDPRSVRDVDTLPSLDDVPFPTAASAQARFAGVIPAVRVLPNGRGLRQNGVEMDNCTLSNSYVRSCESGRTIVAVFDVANRRYNIAWEHTDAGTWKQSELSGAHNAPAPIEVRTIADQLTTRLERLTPARRTGILLERSIAELHVTLPAPEPTPHATNSQPALG